MARPLNSLNLEPTFNVLGASPIDSRMRVEHESDLTNPSTWPLTGAPVFDGMMVSVIDTGDIWILKDVNYSGETESGNGWVKSGGRYVAGENIQISGDTISATDTTYEASDFDIKDLSDSGGLRATWSAKQDALAAGDNIQISGNTISATDTWRQIKLNDVEILGTGTTSEALNILTGANVTIENSNGNLTISATDTTYGPTDFDIKDLADSENLRETWSDKQDALIPGDNIEITEDSVINAKGYFYDETHNSFIELPNYQINWYEASDVFGYSLTVYLDGDYGSTEYTYTGDSESVMIFEYLFQEYSSEGDIFVRISDDRLGKIVDIDYEDKIVFLDRTLDRGSDVVNEQILYYGGGLSGTLNTANGNASHAEGSYTAANGDYSHAEGGDAVTYGEGSHAEGCLSVASGYSSHAEGYQTNAYGSSSHAEGYQTNAYGSNSHAEGYESIASGNSSHAEGYCSLALAEGSHAEGGALNGYIGGIALGISSHAEGVFGLLPIYLNYMSGKTFTFTFTSHDNETYYTYYGLTNPFHTIINATYFDGETLNFDEIEQYLITEREQIDVDDNRYTFAVVLEDYNEYIVPDKGFNGIIYGGIAIGAASHNENGGNISYGNFSHSEGVASLSRGMLSHAEGFATASIGATSHSEGESTVAIGNDSHAEGYGSVTNNLSEHAEGRFNKSHNNNNSYGNSGNTQHSIGIGSDNENRRNAFEVMQNGDVYVYNVGNYDGIDIENAETLQVALDLYVTVEEVLEELNKEG